MTNTVGVDQNPSMWTNKPFGLFTETLPRIYNRIIGRLSDNGLEDAMQDSGFYGTAGSVGPSENVVRPFNPAEISSSIAERDRRASAALRGQNRQDRARPPYVAPEVDAGLSTSDWIAENMGVFDETPYRNYLNFLIEQDADTQARIQAMYAQLADSAQGNMDRVQKIYDRGGKQVNKVYDTATGNVEGAYSSAQQQAADQMARLGIEAVAPDVIDPMALSQAEAVSDLEGRRATGTEALSAYGTSAQDFGSQMAQVGQQQGLEVTSSILAQMLQRQAEAKFQMEQARANFDPYQQPSSRLQLENMYNEPILRGQEQQRQQAFELAKLDIERRMQFDERLRRDVQSFMQAGLGYDAAVEAVLNLTGYNPYGQ